MAKSYKPSDVPFKLNNIETNVKAYLAGNKAQAFKNLGKIRIKSLTEEEKKTLVIAGEMMSGNVGFYSQLGYDLKDMEDRADKIFREHFID